PARPRCPEGVRTVSAVPPSRLPRRARLLVPLLLASLAGCSLLGGGNERERSTIYAPDPRVAIDPSAPAADWQLSLSPPLGARAGAPGRGGTRRGSARAAPRHRRAPPGGRPTPPPPRAGPAAPAPPAGRPPGRPPCRRPRSSRPTRPAVTSRGARPSAR